MNDSASRLAAAERMAFGASRKRFRARVPKVVKFVRQLVEQHHNRFVIELPLQLVSEANQRGNWRGHDRRHAAHRMAGRAAMRFCALDKAAIKSVTITRLAPRLLDDDNATGSAKSCRDGIADAIGRGDGPKCGIKWSVEQKQSAAYGARIEVRT